EMLLRLTYGPSSAISASKWSQMGEGLRPDLSNAVGCWRVGEGGGVSCFFTARLVGFFVFFGFLTDGTGTCGAGACGSGCCCSRRHGARTDARYASRPFSR